MTTQRRNRRPSRRAQIRRRRIVAGVAGVVVVLIVIGVLGGFSGVFGNSTSSHNTSGSTSATDSASWPTFGNTPQNTRANTAASSALPLRTLWTTDTGQLIELPPVIGDGRVIVGNYGYALGIDLYNGAILWKRAAGAYIAASPALTGLPHTASAGPAAARDLRDDGRTRPGAGSGYRCSRVGCLAGLVH
jgi:hypothetical protein